ncbi:MAG TPA: entericidin A/B family lipoprotein [Azospirillaceae bacterium]|nr:entericidin A/B family lipoprotein [Azospirillaceae bacterium]
MKIRRILPAIAAVLFLATSLGACNTVEGFGRDTQAAGRAVSKTAQDVQE